jgi:hypothetical protein
MQSRLPKTMDVSMQRHRQHPMSRISGMLPAAFFIAGLSAAAAAGRFRIADPGSTALRCDYLIVAADSLIGPAMDLAEYRAQSRFDLVESPLVCSMQEITARFPGNGDAGPGLKEFLRFAITKWEQGPRRVLLIGDADTGNLPAPSMVPTRACSLAVSDDWLVTFDSLPAAAIGRIPARTAEEAGSVIAKIIGFERSFDVRRQDICVVTDDDAFRDSCVCAYSPYFAVAENALGQAPPCFCRVKLHSISYPLIGNSLKPGLSDDLLDEMNAGPLLVCFFGHASRTQVWTHEHILVADSVVPKLRPGSLFIMGAFTCQNTAFQYSEWSIGEKFLFASGAGAVAVFGSTGVRTGEYNDYLAHAVMRGLDAPDCDLGSLLLNAKTGFYAGGMDEVALLGDPAMVVRRGTISAAGARAALASGDCDTRQIVFTTSESMDGFAECRVLAAGPRTRGITPCGMVYDYASTPMVLACDTVPVAQGRGVYTFSRTAAMDSVDTLQILISSADSCGWYIGSMLSVNSDPGAAAAPVPKGRTCGANGRHTRLCIANLAPGCLSGAQDFDISGRKERHMPPASRQTVRCTVLRPLP